MSGVMCDKEMPIKIKGKIYKTIVKPAMTYESECLTVKKMILKNYTPLRWECCDGLEQSKRQDKEGPYQE